MDMNLPVGGDGARSRTMSVGELMTALRKFPKNTPVTYHNGWVVGVKTGKGRSQIVCDCYPNCAKGCIGMSKAAFNDKCVEIKLEC